MKYNVEVKETLAKTIEINAKNKEEAVKKVSKMYQSEEIVLDSDDFIDTEIKSI